MEQDPSPVYVAYGDIDHVPYFCAAQIAKLLQQPPVINPIPSPGAIKYGDFTSTRTLSLDNATDGELIEHLHTLAFAKHRGCSIYEYRPGIRLYLENRSTLPYSQENILSVYQIAINGIKTGWRSVHLQDLPLQFDLNEEDWIFLGKGDPKDSLSDNPLSDVLIAFLRKQDLWNGKMTITSTMSMTYLAIKKEYAQRIQEVLKLSITQ